MWRSKKENVRFLPLVLILASFYQVSSSNPTRENVTTRIASACYGNINNWLRLGCADNMEIKVTRVFKGAKLMSSLCIAPASRDTYKKECCRSEPSDCTIEVWDCLSGNCYCNGHPQCEFKATWSSASKQCDQDIYPTYTNYMETEYICVPATKHVTDKGHVTDAPHPNVTGRAEQLTTNTNTTATTISTTATVTITGPDPTGWSETTRSFVVVSQQQAGGGPADDQLSNTMIGAILAGCLGMVFTLVIFIIYWRRKRRLRIISKPQTTVWDYLLNQTFTVRGERGYDHFHSCRSSASSEGEAKSPVIRKNLWLPNISPTDDTQSDVFNDSEGTSHQLEFHQMGTSNPYAFLSLGVNGASSSTHQDA